MYNWLVTKEKERKPARIKGMDYINLYIALPESAYLMLEKISMKKRLTKNEIIVHAILGLLNSHSEDFSHVKNSPN